MNDVVLDCLGKGNLAIYRRVIADELFLVFSFPKRQVGGNIEILHASGRLLSKRTHLLHAIKYRRRSFQASSLALGSLFLWMDASFRTLVFPLASGTPNLSADAFRSTARYSS